MNSIARISLAVALTASVGLGAKVETLSYHSDVLGRDMTYVVMRPADYDQAVDRGERFPVVYLLHGANNKEASAWISDNYCNCTAGLVDQTGIIAVAPDDGEGNRWWLDSPVLADSDMSRFLALELKQKIDTDYATYADRDNTAISGHSMGGFGSLHNALKHPDIYGLSLPMKPGVDLLNPSWPFDFGLVEVLGSKTAERENWEDASITPNAAAFLDIDVALRLYIATRDTWFYEENTRLHRVWDSLGVEHDMRELNDTHGGLSGAMVSDVFGYLDTAFARESSSGARPYPAPGSTPERRMPSRARIPGSPHASFPGVLVYTLTGRRLPAHKPVPLTSGVYFFRNRPALGTKQKLVAVAVVR